jgi:hypothetical protein
VEAIPGDRRPVELYLDAKPVRATEVALVPELCGCCHFEGCAALGTPPSTGPRGTGTAQAKDDPAPFLYSEPRSASGFTATAPPSSPTPAHRPVATKVRPTFLAPLLRPGLRAAGRNDRTKSPPFFCL